MNLSLGEKKTHTYYWGDSLQINKVTTTALGGLKAENSALESLMKIDVRASYILKPCTPVLSAGHTETVEEIKQI